MADEDKTARGGRQTRRTVQGILIMVALVAAGLMVFFLEDILALMDSRYEIVALVPDAPGVAAGTPVWVSGREVGKVQQVAILPTSADTLGRIAVTVELPRRVESQVRTDSRVRITSVSLISEAAVDIVPGSAAAATLAAGDTLRVEPRPDRAQLTEQARQVREDLQQVLATMEDLAPLVRTRMEDTRLAFAAMDATMDEVRRMQADAQANPGLALLRDPAFRESLERARAHVAALPATFDQVRERTGAAGDMGEAVARLRERADTLAAQLDAAAALLDESAGTLGRFRNDAALSRAVAEARASLDSLMAEVRRNPLRFLF
ncbi:MAG TPA: MlaD family protein [Longimicrobiales bacterium]|nr:MlaD family protein [Longimicrobiales bacterium]